MSPADHVTALIAARGHAILLFDDQRRFVGANAAVCRLLGRDLPAIKRMRIADLRPVGGEAEPADVRWRRFLERGYDHGRCAVAVADGGEVLIDFYARANFASGLHMAVFIPVDDSGPGPDPDDNGDSEVPDVKRGNLTQRERDVLALVATGLTGVEIASRLSISPPTVESHVGNAMRKLSATNRAHAIAIAMRAGLISV